MDFPHPALGQDSRATQVDVARGGESPVSHRKYADAGYTSPGGSPLFAIDNGSSSASGSPVGRAPFQTLGGVQEMPGLGEGLQRLSA